MTPEMKLANKVVLLVQAYDHLKTALMNSYRQHHMAMNLLNSRTHTDEWENCMEPTCVSQRKLLDLVNEQFVGPADAIR